MEVDVNRQELERLILDARARRLALLAHEDSCATCRELGVSWETPHFFAHIERHRCGGYDCPDYVPPTHPCAEHVALLTASHAARELAREAARVLGWNSPTAYERATYGRVGVLR